MAFKPLNSSLSSNLNINPINYREIGEIYASQLLTATQRSPLSMIYILQTALSRVKSTMKTSEDKLISNGNRKFDAESSRIKLIEDIVDRVIQRNKNIDGILEAIKSEKSKWNLFSRGKPSSSFEKLKDELTLLMNDLRHLKLHEELLESLSSYLVQSKNEYEITVQESKMDLDYVSGFTDYIFLNFSHYQGNQIELANTFELFSSVSAETRSKVYTCEGELTLLNSRIGILDKTKVIISLLKEISNIDNFIQVSGLTDVDKIQKLHEISLQSISIGNEMKIAESESNKYSQNQYQYMVTGSNVTYSFGGKNFNPNSVPPRSAQLVNGMLIQPLEPWTIKDNSIFYTNHGSESNKGLDSKKDLTPIVQTQNEIGPKSKYAVRIKLLKWSNGWIYIEELLRKSSFEFSNSFQLQSFEFLKNQIELYYKKSIMRPFYDYWTDDIVRIVASQFINYLPYIKSSIHLEALKLLPPLIQNFLNHIKDESTLSLKKTLFSDKKTFKGHLEFYEDYFTIVKKLESKVQLERLEKIVSMGLSIKDNSIYILEGHSFSMFPKTLSTIVNSSIVNPILNQNTKENYFTDESTLARIGSDSVLTTFRVHNHFFTEIKSNPHVFSDFVDKFYQVMSQINASPLDLINDLKKIDTRMTRFKYSNLNNATHGWHLVAIKAIYREAIIRQIKNLNPLESSLYVLDKILKSYTGNFDKENYFFTSMAPKYYFEKVIKEKIDQIIQERLSTFKSKDDLNPIHEIAINAKEKNVEYLITEHLFFRAYQTFQNSLPNKNLNELQEMIKLITNKLNWMKFRNNVVPSANLELEIQYHRKLLSLIELESKERQSK